jgi:hypothetical protein
MASPDEGCGCCDGDGGSDDGSELLAVPRKAVALRDPSEVSLHDPSVAEDDAPFHPGTAWTISSVTLVLSFAHTTMRPAQARSAKTVSTKEHDRRDRFSTPLAPSRS